MSKRNIAIIILVVAVIAAVLFMFFWVREAPTERDLEGLGTELEEADDPTDVPGPETPPPPEQSVRPPAQ